MAPVVHELARRPDRFSVFVCATGQHRELLDRTLDLVGVRLDRNLNVMVHDQSLSGLTARLFDALDPVVRDERPDWLLVQGDTTTAAVGAMTAFYHRVRIATSRPDCARAIWVTRFRRSSTGGSRTCARPAASRPTNLAREHLLREGVPSSRVHVTGNTIVDAVTAIAARPYDEVDGAPGRDSARPRWVLVTTHRRENFGAPLERICGAVDELAATFGSSVHFILPVHPNPNVGATVSRILTRSNCSIVPALDYRDSCFC